MKAVNIEWDIDFDNNAELPTEIEIPEGLIDENEDEMDDYLDEVSDYLSDVTGYCHKGFDIEK